MDELEQKYLVLVERISGYPMREAERTAILARVEAIYRQERSSMTRDAGVVSVGREHPDDLP